MVKKPTLVFMGTASFAVPTLELLVNRGYCVAGVVTAPDKPAGRGQKNKQSAVKEFALNANLPVYQPANLRDESFLNTLQQLRPDLQVVVAFRMLPKEVWALPPLGTINLHASLLPDYRGAAPINHAIINGEKVTGVTTFFINEKMDTGPILMQEKVEIGMEETAAELHDRLMVIGARLVLKTIETISLGIITPISQTLSGTTEKELKVAPKIFREHCRINWKQNVTDVYNFIRGLSPSPGAFTYLKINNGPQWLLKVYEAEMNPDIGPCDLPGSCITDGKTYLKIACSNGYLMLLTVQLEGKKKMSIQDFLRGFKSGISISSDSNT
jgi:methionyl-tRNA formyltransferase